MRAKGKFTLLCLSSLVSLLSCGGNEASNMSHAGTPSNIDLNNIAFTSDVITSNSFGGIGVEWGAYEDTDKIAEGGWDRVINNMDHLGAARIRLMINYDWFCKNFDDKGNNDPNDDTWTYNFTNKEAKNMIEILEYCQTHSIDVAFGAWNVIGSLEIDQETGLSKDVWHMFKKVTSDIRWAKITADVLDFLVRIKGFSCIKWFVNSNEPNWGTKINGADENSSKNYYNTYSIWEQGVKNVRKALDKIGLSHIGIIGGDTTGFAGTEEYFTNIAKRIPTYVADYGFHLYIGNYDIDTGYMLKQINMIHNEVKNLDPGLGVTRQADVWEAGLLDGKTALDCQANITSADYGVRMVDYTLQCLAGGVNGIVYWDFDDAMHFMYQNNTATPKEWGMFSSLAGATSGKQELRPWYHSSSLMTHLFKKGNKIYSPLQNDPDLAPYFRSIATVSQDGTQGGYVCINSALRGKTTKTFYLDDAVSGDKLYIYRFAEGEYRLGADGYIEPNDIIDGSLNKKLTLDVPARTVIVVSNTRL